MINRFVPVILMAAVCTATTALAQDAPHSSTTESAFYASAKADASYLGFASRYEKGKKYTVYQLYPGDEAPDQAAKAATEKLKKQLAKRNTIVVEVPWKSEADLTAALKAEDITATISDGKHIRLKGEKINLNTTSGKAVLVVKEGKVVSLCSGADCNDRLKKFFGLIAVN